VRCRCSSIRWRRYGSHAKYVVRSSSRLKGSLGWGWIVYPTDTLPLQTVHSRLAVHPHSRSPITTSKPCSVQSSHTSLTTPTSQMNLDMLYLATDLTGDKRYAEVATRQAEVSMTSHVRKDYSTYHVVNFDQTTGQPTEFMTHQGGQRF
jgi:hypothetical protein